MPGPRNPRLAAGSVHVWRADLARVGEDVLDLLSDAERDGEPQIARERDSAPPAGSRSRSRGVLKALLARYLQREASAVELAFGAHGKPELAGAENGLFFNLSHSRNLALYAFTTAGQVGLDVEVARERTARRAADRVALARRAFGEREARRLGALEPGPREAEFLRLWVRHEAELKRSGVGLGGGGRASTDGALAGDSPAAVDPSAGPWITELDVGPRAAAALALGSRASELLRWEWT
jgi:4'-phosphopantetheinyl transferase